MALAFGWKWFALLAVSCAAPMPLAGGALPPQGAPSGPDPNESSVPRAERVPASGQFGGGFRNVEAVGQGLEFPLPDAQGWRRDPRDEQNWVARHRRTASTLLVRAWERDGVARSEDCEREARSRRPELPQPVREEVLEQREQLLAGVYQGRVILFVRAAAPPAGGRLEGHALAFGSDVRSCLMLAFSTTALGPRAGNEIAERLSAVAEGVFGRARRIGIDERVQVPRM